MPRPPHWLNRFIALVLAQTLGSLAATSVVTGLDRAAVFLVAVPLITMLLCTMAGFRAKWGFPVVAIATVTTFAGIHLLRRVIHANWFAGPVLPANMELAGYGALAILTMACAASAWVVFSSRGALRKARWIAFGVIAALLVGSAVFIRHSVNEGSPSSLLKTVVRLEQQGAADPGARQELSVMLASCGREADAEAVSRPMAVGVGRFARPDTHSRPVDISRFHARPWREVLTEVAARERLVIVMEAHDEPKHREWLEQALSVFRIAGFRDYAAEGLSESGQSLKQRGYPVSSTGPYVCDPQFGNVLRAAIGLGYELHAYESYGTNFGQREHDQAANLARLFSANPNLKLVVHAGYGHVLKKSRGTGEKSMAAYLWEMTGIEPYCIWQMWHSPEENEARQLAQLLDPGGEPKMLVPAPSGLSDPQLNFPPGAVDALVIHPPSVGGPSLRVHSFPSARRRVTAVWNGSEWPVLVGAFKKGESADAIALDQVMLRKGERGFVLWIPGDDFELRLFGTRGRLNPASADGSPALTIAGTDPLQQEAGDRKSEERGGEAH